MSVVPSVSGKHDVAVAGVLAAASDHAVGCVPAVVGGGCLSTAAVAGVSISAITHTHPPPHPAHFGFKSLENCI